MTDLASDNLLVAFLAAILQPLALLLLLVCLPCWLTWRLWRWFALYVGPAARGRQ